ncbi:MAG: hypothetical protein PSY12_12610 [bacterium]|nr:hypothetical protein [bacterium]
MPGVERQNMQIRPIVCMCRLIGIQFPPDPFTAQKRGQQKPQTCNGALPQEAEQGACNGYCSPYWRKRIDPVQKIEPAATLSQNNKE